MISHEKDRKDQNSSYIEGYGYVDTRAVAAIEKLCTKQSWIAAGGNPEHEPSTEELHLCLKMLDNICDDADELMTKLHRMRQEGHVWLTIAAVIAMANNPRQKTPG